MRFLQRPSGKVIDRILKHFKHVNNAANRRTFKIHLEIMPCIKNNFNWCPEM